jgi:hypothetical protein
MDHRSVSITRQRTLQIYSLVAFFEGLLALFFIWRNPSLTGKALVIGISPWRIGLGGMMMIGLALAFLLLLLSFSPNKFNSFTTRQDHWLIAQQRLPGSLFLLFLALGGVLVTLFVLPHSAVFWGSFLSDRFSNLVGLTLVIIQRAFPLLSWLAAVVFQTIVILLYQYSAEWRSAGFFNWPVLGEWLLAAVMIPLTLFHWAVLFFNLYFFVALPHWFWKQYNLPNTQDAFFILLAALAIVVTWWVIRHPKAHKRNLLILVVAGYVLQIMVGFMEGQGYESLRQDFLQRGHWGYALYSCRQHGILWSMIHYEEVAPSDPFFVTKPPGVVLFYQVAERISNFINPSGTVLGRYANLSWFLVILFPLLASLAVVPLYYLSRSILDEDEAGLPGVFFILLPNFLLTALYLDQGFYPLVFVCGLLLVASLLKRPSFWRAFLCGVFIYVAMYFSFSLLPLIPFALAWTGLDYWRRRRELKLTGLLMTWLGIAAGLLATLLVMRVTLNYDILLRYQNAMGQHRIHKDFADGIQQIRDAIVLNNAEMADWIGFPVALLFLTRLVKSAVAFFRDHANRLDVVTIAFFATYAALNIFGQTRSEVARLWLFLCPLFALFSSHESRQLFRKHKNAGVWLVIALQLVTTLLLFQFQNLD